MRYLCSKRDDYTQTDKQTKAST